LLVMGSGSVGSLFGGLLAAEKFDVLLVGRKEHIERINESGLKIKGLINKNVTVSAVETITEAQEFLEKSGKTLDYVFITTKAHQSETAAKQLQVIINSETVLISIQNGIGTEDLLKEIYPENIVLRGITTIGVCKPEPGVVDFTGEGQTFIGYQTAIEEQKAGRMVEMMRKSGINASLESNILGAVFTKTIVNCALNPLTALYNVKNKEIYNQVALRNQAKTLAEEAWAVTKVLKIELLTNDPIKMTFDIIKKTGENTSSMLTDILNKRKTEIDFLNGKIITLGLKEGINVIHNQEIYNKILTLEKSFLE
ncbi:MAG: 2-dehydropantoate 2-reductase, partial [Asgard group archaeon]|nr:2-dehydropantoate 2-reductase [Asgard group archaeon]